MMKNKKTISLDKNTENILLASEMRYRRLFESAKDGILILDAKTGKIIDVNPYLLEMIGYVKAELLGVRLWEIAAFNELVASQDAFNALTESQYLHYDNLHLVSKPGEHKDVEFVSNVYRVDEEKVLHCNIRDITERKRAEEEKARLEMRLRESQKMEAVGQLAGGVAHDFNNLLTVINGYTQMLLLSSDSSTQPELEEVLRAGERASALTRQLLVFSRRQALESKIIDFNAIISDMEKMLRRLIREDISLERISGSDLWPVKADPGQMEQVIMNLVINARDAMPDGGKLTIQTENVKIDGKRPLNYPGDMIPGYYVKFSVSDTGCGMSDEVKKHLFEPFFTTKEEGSGTGLGLATVYGIVKQNGGYIDVQSEVGAGSRFQIYLPRITSEILKGDKELKATPILKGRETILLVEDECNVRIIIREFLKSIGYVVLLASNGKEALEIAKDHKEQIHLLLTDIVMPGMSGLELAKQLNSMFPEMKLLFMSGYAKSSDGKGLLDINTNFIQKPISIYPLSIKLREILDK
jgi:PAS domain S-box-containing protein